MGKTRAYNLKTQQSPSYRRGAILWLMWDNNIKWAVNKHTYRSMSQSGCTSKNNKKTKKTLLLQINTNAFSYYMGLNVLWITFQAFHDRCVQSSYWQALIPHGSSGMCCWPHYWMGSFGVKGQFLMLYLDKLDFKAPVTIYHALWVIRLQGALGLDWVWLSCRLDLRTCVCMKIWHCFSTAIFTPTS